MLLNWGADEMPVDCLPLNLTFLFPLFLLHLNFLPCLLSFLYLLFGRSISFLPMYYPPPPSISLISTIHNPPSPQYFSSILTSLPHPLFSFSLPFFPSSAVNCPMRNWFRVRFCCPMFSRYLGLYCDTVQPLEMQWRGSDWQLGRSRNE